MSAAVLEMNTAALIFGNCSRFDRAPHSRENRKVKMCQLFSDNS